MPLKKLTQSATRIILKGRKLSGSPEETVPLPEFLEILRDNSKFGLSDLVNEFVESSEWQEDRLSLKLLLETAFDEARRMQSSYVGTEHLFLGLIRLGSPKALEEAREEVAGLSGIPPVAVRRETSTATPLLDSFGTDLVQAAKQGKLDPFFGRAPLLEHLEQALLRREKSNPLVIGEAGVGKTALVNGFASKIANKEVPPRLINKRIIQLNFSRLLGAVGPRKGLAAGFSALLGEVASQDDVILFVDEMHQLMGKSFLVKATSSLVEILKDALEERNFQFIGATTSKGYSRYFEFDQGLVRRVEPVLVKEPSEEETESILRAVAPRFEKFHRIQFEDSVYKEIIRLAERYVPQGNFPDKAIEILDDLGAKLRVDKLPNNDISTVSKALADLEKELEEKMEASDWDAASDLRKRRDDLRENRDDLEATAEESCVVGADLVAEVVSQKAGRPLTDIKEDERQRLANIEEALSHYVIGQDHAVRALGKTLRRSRVGLANAERPIGSFLFLGPTGVGKTELARRLADFLFEDGDLIRFDMSEFRERHTASRLIGAPPGYVGYGRGGELTERVRKNPYSVVLFDEMEKAHPEVLNLLLQIMEEGELRDGKGTLTDFTKTIVVLTSNVGAELVSKGHLGFDLGDSPQSEYERVKSNLLDDLKSRVRPEFLNRLNEVIVFRPLTPSDLEKIVELRLSELEERMEGLGLALEVTQPARKLLAKLGYSKEYGARPLQRIIEDKIEAPLSEGMVGGEVGEGDSIKIRVRKGAIEVCPQ